MSILNTTGCDMYNPDIIKADNCTLIDKEGREYYDFDSGVWALPLGHNHPRIQEAIINQLNQIIHVGYRYSHPVVTEAADILLDIMNLKNGKCLFLSSGSEAVEFAIKAALKISNKPYLLFLDKHYVSAYGVSGDMRANNGIALDWQKNLSQSGQDYEELLKDIPFDEIAAFVLEPGNASGTVKLPPKELITYIASKVKANKGWIIVDEVTTGMGRTGRWFCYENYEVKPDFIACGKGLGNGYPVSAVGMSEEAVKLIEASDFIYGQSHLNDPLGCAVALEVIKTIKETSLLEKASELGSYLKDELLKLKNKHSCIKEVRGSGLMCAIEFVDPISSKISNADYLLMLHKELYEAGFIVGLKPIANVMRFYPSLTVEKNIMDGLITALNQVLLHNNDIG